MIDVDWMWITHIRIVLSGEVYRQVYSRKNNLAGSHDFMMFNVGVSIYDKWYKSDCRKINDNWYMNSCCFSHLA